MRQCRKGNPEVLRAELENLIVGFEKNLREGDIRAQVRALIPSFHTLRDLGCSLAPTDLPSARDRILSYLLKYPGTIIDGDELMVVSGIQEYARRLRELRVQFGWPVFSGVTVSQMFSHDEEGKFGDLDLSVMKPDQYILLSEEQDRDAAHRWQVANEIRKTKVAVRDKILRFLRENVHRPVTGEELRYVAKGATEWARRVRELRTEQGWPVLTRNNGRPDLPVGTYLLEADRQAPKHDRKIPDSVRRAVLRRDEYMCVRCGWTRKLWNPDDARHLEAHHLERHVDGGKNVEDNLITVCNVCHDRIHADD